MYSERLGSLNVHYSHQSIRVSSIEVHRLHHMFGFYLTVAKSVYIKKKDTKGATLWLSLSRHSTGVYSEPLPCWEFACSPPVQNSPACFDSPSAQNEKTALKSLIGMNVSASDSLSSCISPVMDMWHVQGVNFCFMPAVCFAYTLLLKRNKQVKKRNDTDWFSREIMFYLHFVSNDLQPQRV